MRRRDGLPWDEIVFVTAADIPGTNTVPYGILDQPCLGHDILAHSGEAVALVAHSDPAITERAREAVLLDLEPLHAVRDTDEALARRTILFGDDNTFREIRIDRGRTIDAHNGAIRFDATYRTGAQDRVYLQPCVMIAEASAGGALVCGSLLAPHSVRDALVTVLGLDANHVRAVPLEGSSAFGGEDGNASLVASHAALLSLKAGGRPVRMRLDRPEDMAVTPKRHPSQTRIRSAFADDGRLLALEVDLVLDGGAYSTTSPLVLARAAVHASGPYRILDLRIRARAVATSRPPSGALPGHGGTQACFAIERHLDEVACALGLTPVEIRRRNLLRKGEAMATGGHLPEGVDLEALLDEAASAIRLSSPVRPATRWTRHGTGVSLFFLGADAVPPSVDSPARLPPESSPRRDETTLADPGIPSRSFGAYAAAVCVDLSTYEVNVEHLVAVHEVGRDVQETLTAGRIAGGIAQGLGFALSEEVILRDGCMINTSLTDYLVPTTLDVPPIDVRFRVSKNPGAGAAGLWELPLVGTASAVLSAVHQAVGCSPRETPMTPERLMDLLDEGQPRG